MFCPFLTEAGKHREEVSPAPPPVDPGRPGKLGKKKDPVKSHFIQTKNHMIISSSRPQFTLMEGAIVYFTRRRWSGQGQHLSPLITAYPPHWEMSNCDQGEVIPESEHNKCFYYY